MLDTTRFRVRWAVFSLLIAGPMIRRILFEGYGLLHVEVGVMLLIGIALAALLAVVTYRSLAFHCVLAALIVLFSVDAARSNFFPQTRVRFLLPAAVASVAALMFVLRKNFVTLLVVFLAGSLLADVGKSLFTSRATTTAAGTSANVPRKHVLYLIVDEMLGLAAFPEHCKECTTAKQDLESTLVSGNFKIYPYAFSNYAATRDSIPSILNGKLVNRCNELVMAQDESRVTENRLFRQFADSGYAIRVFQSDYLDYTASISSTKTIHTYRTHDLSALHRTDMPWPDRTHELVRSFIRSDQFWLHSLVRPLGIPLGTRVFPSLSVPPGWHSAILNELQRAQENTLVFAHILLPHFPYVYRLDKPQRPSTEWAHSDSLPKLQTVDQESYRRLYEEYGEQVRFVNQQLSQLLAGLRDSGLYDSTLIVIHGDHGSRLQQATSAQDFSRGAQNCLSPARYTYVSEPDLRDLLNRFATLFAIKAPNTHRPEIRTERASVMNLLWNNLPGASVAESPEATNSVYLFDDQEKPRTIPLANLWQPTHVKSQERDR